MVLNDRVLTKEMPEMPKTMMRLLHVAGSALQASGGPIEGIRQGATVLCRRGHSVELATLDAPGAPDFEQLGIPVHAMGPTMTHYKYCPKLLEWLEANHANYDAIIVDGIWQYHGWAVRKVCKKANLPYFVFTHGMLDPWFNKAFPLKRLKKLVYWPWQYQVLKDARAVLFTTEEEKLLARRSFRPYKVVERVIPYGTSTPPPATPDQEQAFYAAVPAAKGKRCVLFLGRLHPKKGLDLLIQAYAKVFANDPDWILVAAGPDLTGWKAKLVQLAKNLGISDRVVWPGMLQGDAKWGAFREAAAFVLPSHQENFGVAVAEALACGTPALISNKVNIWREVEASRGGIVADDTLDGAVQLLQKLKDLPLEDRKEMGRLAIDCFSTHFEASRMALGIENVVTEAVG